MLCLVDIIDVLTHEVKQVEIKQIHEVMNSSICAENPLRHKLTKTRNAYEKPFVSSRENLLTNVSMSQD